MKKYIFRYIFIVILIGILFFTRDFQPKLFLAESSDYLNLNITDGFYGVYEVLLANTCFSLILSIATVVTTMSKENKVKFKYVIASTIILVLFFLLPFIKQTYIGDENNLTQEKYHSVFSYITHIF